MTAFACAVPLELTLCLCARLELPRLPWGQPRSRQPRQTEHDPCRMCTLRVHACACVVLDGALSAFCARPDMDCRALRARCERESRLEQ